MASTCGQRAPIGPPSTRPRRTSSRAGGSRTRSPGLQVRTDMMVVFRHLGMSKCENIKILRSRSRLYRIRLLPQNSHWMLILQHFSRSIKFTRHRNAQNSTFLSLSIFFSPIAYNFEKRLSFVFVFPNLFKIASFWPVGSWHSQLFITYDNIE